MKNYLISDIKNKRILGRNVKGGTGNDGSLTLFWAAAALEVNIKATEIWAEITSDYDSQEIWLAVEVNGFQTARFIAPKETTLICLARNLNPEKENLISIIKDTQPMPGDDRHLLKINSLALNDEGCFCHIKKRKLKIEFIGDSLTSGEGLAGKADEMDWITQWFCGSKTYAVQTAKLLDADWSCISLCGCGLCWGWDGNVNSRIPPFYSQVCGLLNGENQKKGGACEALDFEGGSDYVILNLGTNDNSGFKFHAEENPAQLVVNEVKRFLGEIRSCNPDAKIIWSWGLMFLDTMPALLKRGIEEYKMESGDKAVYSLELEDMNDIEKNEEDKGSRGHPGLLSHKKAAARIVDFIRSLDA